VIAFDVNVFVTAHVAGQEHHIVALKQIEGAMDRGETIAVSDLVLSGYVRIVTNHRYLRDPDTVNEALAFCDALKARPNVRVLTSGPRHWDIFADLCRVTEARGAIVSDAYHAALAVEHNCEWISFDRDFARFPGLRWRSPLD